MPVTMYLSPHTFYHKPVTLCLPIIGWLVLIVIGRHFWPWLGLLGLQVEYWREFPVMYRVSQVLWRLFRPDSSYFYRDALRVGLGVILLNKQPELISGLVILSTN